MVLNVTAVSPANAGWLTVFPTGAPKPPASNLNFTAGQDVPNLVVAKLGTDGKISINNSTPSGPTHIVADIAGWFPEFSSYEPLVPERVLDTRNGTGAPQGTVAGGATIDLQIAGAAESLPPAPDPWSSTSPPCPPRRRMAHRVPHRRPQTPRVEPQLHRRASRPQPRRRQTRHRRQDQHQQLHPQRPHPHRRRHRRVVPRVLLLRTVGPRAGPRHPQRHRRPQGTVAGGATIDLQIAGRGGGVPATGAGSVVLNVTAVSPANAGWLTVFPTGAPKPLASNLNFTAGQVVPNLVVAKLGTDGKISINNSTPSGPTHIVADIAGWFPDGTSSSTTMDLLDGTVLGGPGDVVSITGDSDTGGTVILSASADIPDIGDHLAIGNSNAFPGGISGLVTAVTTNPDGTTTITVAPVDLDDMFANIVVDGAIAPTGADGTGAAPLATMQDPPPGTATPQAIDCESDAGPRNLDVADVSLGNWDGTFDVDISEGTAHAAITAEATVTWTGIKQPRRSAARSKPQGRRRRRRADDHRDGPHRPSRPRRHRVGVAHHHRPHPIGFAIENGDITNLSGATIDGDAVTPEVRGLHHRLRSRRRHHRHQSLRDRRHRHRHRTPSQPHRHRHLRRTHRRTLRPTSVEIGRWGIEWEYDLADFSLGKNHSLEGWVRRRGRITGKAWTGTSSSTNSYSQVAPTSSSSQSNRSADIHTASPASSSSGNGRT